MTCTAIETHYFRGARCRYALSLEPVSERLFRFLVHRLPVPGRRPGCLVASGHRECVRDAREAGRAMIVRLVDTD